ncbi:MAG: hypothetical protein ACKVT1_07235, partial [Dehalococcoidia bacterium]
PRNASRRWTREVVGLVLFGVALAVGLSVVLPGRSDGRGPSSVTTGPVTGGGSLALKQPQRWTVQYFAIEAAEGSEPAKLERTGDLRVESDGAPFDGLRDDGWRVRAEASFTAPPGNYTFTLQHVGPIQVMVNGTVAAQAPLALNGEQLVVAFSHPGGTLSLRIDSEDHTGPFVLRWR